jgi:hypothetical protein
MFKGIKGEGSKGGKIIGHTKSGKPIYEGKLLASSPSKEKIVKLISQYYMGSSIHLEPHGENLHSVHNKNGEINDVYVEEKKGRWHFKGQK